MSVSKEIYAERKLKGVCTDCGKRPAVTTLCEHCREIYLKASRKYNKKVTSKGLCPCGKVKNGKYKCDDCTAYLLTWHTTNKLKLKKIAFEKYGNCCACCGETTFEFLQIDHKNNDGGKYRKNSKRKSIFYELEKLNYPDTFQLLCSNCNWSKGVYGYCPHIKTIKSFAGGFGG